jgi:hypothetical protein
MVFRLRRRRRETAGLETCPSCRAEGHLKLAADPSGESGGQVLRCANVLDELGGRECGFSFPARLKGLPKLLFPVAGIRGSGQTTWLKLVTRQLDEGTFPEGMDLRRMPSGADEEARTPGGPDPHAPVVFHFRQTGGSGRREGFMTLWNPPGEYFVGSRLESEHRRRFGLGDGFVLLVDPTQSGADQQAAVMLAAKTLYAVRQAPRGRPLGVPIAVCLSKIDWLASRIPEDHPERRLIDALTELPVPENEIDRDAVSHRSRIAIELCQLVWPGWPIERLSSHVFGKHVAFFPMSALGFDPPREDLALILNPWGMLHPIFWLLHVKGYLSAKKR